ncbi:hypothetical protein RQP46_003160 [Phenoliferia psychrophenolica]
MFFNLIQYALSSTALIPWTASLAGIFGRKVTLQASILLFIVGSTVCGAARSIGPYFGLIGGVWALASTIGPPISGALASAGQYKWLFWMNLPIGAVALSLVTLFMDLKRPVSTFSEKMALMDWYNLIFVGASTSVVLALSWAGTSHAWTSAAVLAPLIIGCVGLVAFVYLDQFSSNPTVPLAILRHPTAVMGYISTCGIVVAKSRRYKWLNVSGWGFTMVGLGLLSLQTPTSPTSTWVIYPMSGVIFPIQAPLDPALQPDAVGLMNFLRSFGQVLGIAIGGTIVQNELRHSLPPEFVEVMTQAGAFGAIPYIKTLTQPVLGQVQSAYASSLRQMFIVMIGLSGLGLLASLAMKDLALTTKTNEKWGLTERHPALEKRESPGAGIGSV